MTKECGTFDHTADVGLAARADSLGELYEALAEGLADYICSRQQVRPARTLTLSVRAEDAEVLAVDFLCRVLATIQSDRFLIASVRVTKAATVPAGAELTAELHGEPYDPARHELHTEVKAVTYHLLRVARDGDQWVARVILDL